MNIEDCKHSTSWDYLGWTPFSDFYGQLNWNETLITMVNQISAHIHKSSFRRGADTIIINPKNLILFNSFYDQETQSLRNRYKIVLNDDISLNHIFVCNRTDNTNPQMVVRPVEVGDGEIPEIMVLHERQCTPEEVLEYKRNLCGYIEIQNYNEGIEPVKNIKKFKL
jgi:hypothetical protein